MNQEVLRLVGTLLATQMILPLTLFLYRYLRYSPWRSTDPGKALAYLAIALDTILIVGMVYLIFPPLPGWLYVRIVCYAVLSVTIWWLPILLIRMQRAGHDVAAEAEEAVVNGDTPPEGIRRVT